MLIKMKSEYLQSFWSLKNSCMGIILVICTGCSTVAINSVDQKTTDEQTETIMVGEVPIPQARLLMKKIRSYLEPVRTGWGGSSLKHQ